MSLLNVCSMLSETHTIVYNLAGTLYMCVHRPIVLGFAHMLCTTRSST